MRTKVILIIAVGFNGTEIMIGARPIYGDRHDSEAACEAISADDTFDFTPAIEPVPKAGVYECTADVYVSDNEDDGDYEITNIKIVGDLTQKLELVGV